MNDYSNKSPDELHALIQSRRNSGRAGFENITATSSVAEMIAALQADDGRAATGTSATAIPPVGATTPYVVSGPVGGGPPVNIPVPEHVVVRKPPVVVDLVGGPKVVGSPEVVGDQSLAVVDLLNGKFVHVSLLDGLALTPDIDGRLIFVESSPVFDLMTIRQAKGKFAVKKDGTLVYGQRGFDDVPHDSGLSMIDIVALIEFNHAIETKAETDEAKQSRLKAVTEKKVTIAKKAADDKIASDKKAADEAAVAQKAADEAAQKAADKKAADAKAANEKLNR